MDPWAVRGPTAMPSLARWTQWEKPCEEEMQGGGDQAGLAALHREREELLLLLLELLVAVDVVVVAADALEQIDERHLPPPRAA